MNFPKVPISNGELLDKITILKIKSEKIKNNFIDNELDDLIKIAKNCSIYEQKYIEELYEINLKLWDIEDNLRKLEKLKKFDDEFISLARSVYINNDKRSLIKKNINEKTKSVYQEIKVY